MKETTSMNIKKSISDLTPANEAETGELLAEEKLMGDMTICR